MIKQGVYLTRRAQYVKIDETMIDKIEQIASGGGVEVYLEGIDAETKVPVTTTLAEGEIAVRSKRDGKVTIIKALDDEEDVTGALTYALG